MSGVSKVLVTGVAGLLGSHLSEYLVNKGHKVFGVDNLSGGYLENIHPSVTFFQIDLTDRIAVEKMMETHKFDFVYHFAAYAAVGLSPFIRNFNYTNNILASVNLINGAIKYSVRKFIFASSMDVYGEQKPPFTEDMRPNPQDPYGIAKYAIEMDLANAKRQFGLDYWIIRPHNVIGPRQNIWDKYRNVAGIWIRKAMAGEPLTVYGDGTQRRAFSDVKYYMKPFESLMKIPTNAGPFYSPIINIGADKDVSINELATIVADVAHEKMGVRPPIMHLEPRDEVKDMWCDHSRAKSLLQFEDSTCLYNLIGETWDWAVQIKPKAVKYMEYEINKGLYPYWRKK
jgi:UDP-glucose 4-epimerase